MGTKDVRFGASYLQLKRFSIDDMVDHCTIAMIAKRWKKKMKHNMTIHTSQVLSYNKIDAIIYSIIVCRR